MADEGGGSKIADALAKLKAFKAEAAKKAAEGKAAKPVTPAAPAPPERAAAGEAAAEQREAKAEERKADAEEREAKAEEREAEAETKKAEAAEEAPPKPGIRERLAAARQAGQAAAGKAKAVGRGALFGGKLLGKGMARAGKAVNEQSVNIFFVVTMLEFYFVDNVVPNNLRFTIYFAFAMWSWLAVFKEPGGLLIDRQSLRALGKACGIALAAFLFPVILNRLMIGGIISPVIMNTVLTAFPFYLIWFVFIEPSTKFLRAWQKWIIIFWIIIAIGFVYVQARAGALQLPGIESRLNTDYIAGFSTIKEMFVTATVDIKEGLVSVFTGVKRGVRGRINESLADFYVGQVDTKAKEKLGVYIEGMKKTDPQFYTDEPVGVYATIVARTLDKEDQIPIKIRCVADKDNEEKKKAADVIGPKPSFTVEDEFEEDIDCTFNPGKLEKGSHTISLFADFSFKTQAYLKTYFVDADRARAMRRQDIDILEQAGITDKSPKAIFTNGPVMIGIESRNPPILVDTGSDEPLQKSIGMTIRNQWAGKVLKIKNLEIILPDGVKLKDNKCGAHEFTKSDNTYTMVDAESRLGEIETYKSIRCTILVDKPDFPTVLGETPVGIRYLKINTEYDYSLSKTLGVSVKERK